MRILILFLLCLNISYVKADEIYNLLKIPNLEIYKLKSENNIRYLNTKGDFEIGVNDNIKCNKVNQKNLIDKFSVIEKNLNYYNSKFLKNINLKYVVLCEDLSISNIKTAGIPDNVMKTLIIDIKFNQKYFERVIHHEVFHIINDSYKDLFNYDDWSKFNNDDFNYAECSTCTEKLGLDTYSKTNGFITEYSQSTASEDMAEVFSHLVMGLIPDNNDPILKNKVKFLKSKLQELDENFKL